LQVFQLRSAGAPQVLDEAGWSIHTDGMITLSDGAVAYATASVVDEGGTELALTPVEAIPGRTDALLFALSGGNDGR
jgi:hypothetical protein